MAKKPRIDQYSGPLMPAQAAEGIEAAIQNAKALLSDAELLLHNQRWQRATALAILAIEEAEKVSLLRGLLLARNDAERRKEWRAYRTYVKKNLAYILPQLFREGSRKLEDFRSIYDEVSDHGLLLESLKQIALYTDAYADCHWSVPEEVIEQDVARTIVSIAEVLIPDEPGAFTSEAELKIWVKHLGPVWKGKMSEMKRALLACYAEADALGVLRGEHSPRDTIKFVL